MDIDISELSFKELVVSAARETDGSATQCVKWIKEQREPFSLRRKKASFEAYKTRDNKRKGAHKAKTKAALAREKEEEERITREYYNNKTIESRCTLAINLMSFLAYVDARSQYIPPLIATTSLSNERTAYTVLRGIKIYLSTKRKYNHWLVDSVIDTCKPDTEWSGEKELMWAVIEQAIRDAALSRSTNERREAAAYLSGDVIHASLCGADMEKIRRECQKNGIPLDGVGL